MTTRRSRRPARSQDQWMQYVRGNVTQSAANTFTEATVNLPVVVAQGFVIEAYMVEFQHPPLLAADLTATDDQITPGCQLTKSSQTVMVNLDDPDLIAGYERQLISVDIQTAEGTPVTTNPHIGEHVMIFPQPILLPFEQIYFGAVTTLGSGADVYRFRLGFKTIRLSTTQLVELISAIQ